MHLHLGRTEWRREGMEGGDESFGLSRYVFVYILSMVERTIADRILLFSLSFVGTLMVFLENCVFLFRVCH